MGNAVTGEVLHKPPASSDVSARNIFYMHGRCVKMNGQPYHRVHGLDDYDDIISKIAERGMVLFGKVRTNDTRIIEYAEKITA